MALIKLATVFCFFDMWSYFGNTVEVPKQSVPFMASLRIMNSDNISTHVCSGSIVHPRFVVTAASCFYTATGETQKLFKVLVGTDATAISNEGTELIDIKEQIAHPAFNLESDNYDIGLVRLRRALSLGNAVAVIPLLTSDVRVGNEVHVSFIEKGIRKYVLRQTRMPVVETWRCRVSPLLGRVLTPAMLCAGDAAADLRINDYGGSLYHKNALAAVATRQRGCGGVLGVYTRISRTRSWLESIIKSYL